MVTEIAASPSIARYEAQGGDSPDVTPQLCERFLLQMQAHHRVRDHYPDPREIGAELELAPTLTHAVVEALRARVWVGRSPYDTVRLRVTPYGWERLRRHPCTAAVGVDRLVAIAPTPQEPRDCGSTGTVRAADWRGDRSARDAHAGR
jgi:hypothetical protein